MAGNITQSSVFEALKLDVKQKKELERVEKRQMELEDVNREGLDTYEGDLDKILKGKQDADVSQLSRLDQGIERGRQFKGEITDLAQSLTDELNELGQFFGDMAHYKGALEQTLSKVGLIKWADKARLFRVNKADIKESLDTILDYGHHMVGKLYEAILQNTECHVRIAAAVDRTALTLEQNQPHYEKWRSGREELQRAMVSVENKLDAATPTEYGSIEIEKAQIQAQLDEATVNENHYFTIVDKARKALPVQRTHLSAYRDLVDSLTQFRTGLEQDIMHVTEIYQSTPVAIQTALKVKASSQYDKGMKYATDRATDTVLRSVKGVLDETASRAERPLIEDEKLRAYQTAQREARAQFEVRITEIKQRYAKTDAAS